MKLKSRSSPFSLTHIHCQHVFCFWFRNLQPLSKCWYTLTVQLGILDCSKSCFKTASSENIDDQFDKICDFWSDTETDTTPKKCNIYAKFSNKHDPDLKKKKKCAVFVQETVHICYLWLVLFHFYDRSNMTQNLIYRYSTLDRQIKQEGEQMPIIHIQGRKIQLVMLFVDLPMTIK